MNSVKVLLISASIILCSTYGYTQTTDCNRRGQSDTIQRIQAAVYEKINAAKAASIPDSTLKKLKDDYASLSASINKVFKSMSGDLGLLYDRKKLCEKYSPKLAPHVAKANNYVKEVQKALNERSAGAGGGDWIGVVIDVVFNVWDKLETKRQEVLYNRLAWAKSWDEVPAN